MQKLKKTKGKTLCLSGLPHNKIALAGQDTNIYIWDTLTSKWTRTLKMHTDWVTSLERLPSERLASGSRNGVIYIWHTPTGKCIRQMNPTKKSVTALAALPDNLLAAQSNGSVYVLNTETKECLQKLCLPKTNSFHLSALPNNKLAWGSISDTEIAIQILGYAKKQKLEKEIVALQAPPQDDAQQKGWHCAVS